MIIWENVILTNGEGRATATRKVRIRNFPFEKFSEKITDAIFEWWNECSASEIDSLQFFFFFTLAEVKQKDGTILLELLVRTG